jgi:tripeptide aminopeptidase
VFVNTFVQKKLKKLISTLILLIFRLKLLFLSIFGIIIYMKEGNYMKNLVERFLRYVQIDTQSDYDSSTFPSTEKQKNLSKVLVDELNAMGLSAFLDEHGYVYTKIEGNVKGAQAIGFIAHVDTSPDAPGANVKPRIIEKYQGETIHLNDKIQMSPALYPSLNKVIGEDIIVTDGNTLLGADDKCGVAEIMELAHYIMLNPEFKHGDIYICFTPDEEIGKGTDHFNHDFFKADYAYTADGSEVGGIEFENFNAASAVVEFTGISIHPGTAKNKMINAQHLAIEFHQLLPKHLDPSLTEHYEGFNHLTNIQGTVEKAVSKYIIRNHDKNVFNRQKEDFNRAIDFINKKYAYACACVTIKDSYYNMHDIIKDHMYIVERAQKAIEKVGLKPFTDPIRGGTDGARLTFEGLPCPNLGTGGFQFHGRLEFASIQQMEKAVKILIEIARHQ